MTARRTPKGKIGCAVALCSIIALGWLGHDAVAGWLVDERVAGSLLAGGGEPADLAVAAGFLLGRVAASLALPALGAMVLAGALATAARRRGSG